MENIDPKTTIVETRMWM